MDAVQLLSILKDGESTSVEFKEAFNKNDSLCKAICAFANTKGGKILIGVKDDGTPVGIQGHKLQDVSDQVNNTLIPMPAFNVSEITLAQAKIIVIDVEESSRLVSANNMVYIRVGTNNHPLSIDEVIEKSSESLRVFFDQIPSEVPASELDKNLLNDYLKRRERQRGVEFSGDAIETAVSLKILAKKGKGLFLTNGGILCFTENPQKYIGNSTVRLTKFEDNEMKSYSFSKDFGGPLQKIVDDIEKYFVGSLSRVGGFTVGFKRQEFLEYPLAALREAIINAIIHRNYFDAAEIRIFIFPDRIEIRNPGSFPPGVSIENPEHKPRNPQIAQFFYDMGLTEKYGSGIRKIIRETAEHPLTGVKFSPRPYNTTVSFIKTLTSIDLDAINLKILDSLAAGSKASGAVAQEIGLSRQAAVERLRNLTNLGFIKKEGEGPKTVYELGKVFS